MPAVLSQNRAYGSVHGSSWKLSSTRYVKPIRHRTVPSGSSPPSFVHGLFPIPPSAVPAVYVRVLASGAPQPDLTGRTGACAPSGPRSMFRPSPPTSVSLSAGFPLRHVTMPSSAGGFTATTASSATPRHIARHCWSAWSVSWRSSTADGADGSSPGKSLPSVAPWLPSLRIPVTERSLDFGVLGRLIPGIRLTKVRFRLVGSFDSGFLQIPHWTYCAELSVFPGNAAGFLRTPLPSPISSLLSR